MFTASFTWPPSNWLTVVMVAAGAALLAMMIHRVVRGLVVRAVRRSKAALAVIQQATGPASLLWPLIAVQAVWHAAPDDLIHINAVRHVTLVLLLSAATWLVMRCIVGLEQAVIAAHPSTPGDNLEARRISTQTHVLGRSAMVLVGVIGASLVLMTFQEIRQIGASLLASAGVAGIIAGLAARPVLGNLIAGLQIGLTQPIRLDDVVIVEGEWGWIEEIGGAYVVVRLWDQRRLVVPLQWWIEHPFQNWTRRSSDIIGTVFLWVDYRLPLEPLRAELQRLCEAAPEWDRRVSVLQVTDANERAMQLRILVSSADSPRNWDLRCKVREGLIAFVQRQHADCLPRVRAEFAESQPLSASAERSASARADGAAFERAH
ncbi:MAG TPA: mechanosensitive ion channel family protein [Burkholderiaceae bacterium]|nr:mechanosensitive ion channel family protein [Burkholderiaceae bacterium]